MLNRPRHCVLLLILLTSIIRLLWAAGLELANDEAYHFLYTIHPDWSYFDHPPMLMWVASAGRCLCGGWLSTLSLRLGFVLLFAGSSWILYEWTARWYGQWAGFYAAFALNLSAYYTAAAGAFILPDGPFLFFALLTMQCLSRALFGLKPNAIGPWIGVGLACAAAMTSKYHAVLLPAGTLGYVVLTPKARGVLLTPGPYLAATLSVAGLIPVLVWNAHHDWASIAFQGGRAVGLQFNPRGLAAFLFGPIGYLLPWIWVPVMTVLISRLKRLRTLEGHDRFLVCLSILPLTLFFAVSCVRAILPHWPLIGFIPMFPLVGELWAQQSVDRPLLVMRWLRFMSIAVLMIMISFFAQARFGLLDLPWRSDPAVEISGWESVGRTLKEQGTLDRPNTFLFTDHWYESGQLAFAVRDAMPVACYNIGDARGFAYWSRPENWVGQDAFWITTEQNAKVSDFVPYFRSVRLQSEFFMTRSGKPFRKVWVYECQEQLKPFPFQYNRAN